MDVLSVAWAAAGSPTVVAPVAGGRCSRCGRAGLALVPTGRVVSKVFTGFDGWADPCGAGLCPCCVWGYRDPALRMAGHLVTADPQQLFKVIPARIGELLAAPLPGDVAVVVPLRPGRKHLVPEAVWGRVTIDDVRLPWSAADAGRLAVMRRLRGQGFGTRMLRDAAPPWPVIRRLQLGDRAEVLGDWPLLDPWRTRRPWFDLAVHATVLPAVGQAA